MLIINVSDLMVYLKNICLNFRKKIDNNLYNISYSIIFFVFFITSISLIFNTKDTYMYVIAIYIFITNIVYVLKYKSSVMSRAFVVNRICFFLVLSTIIILFGIFYITLYKHNADNLYSHFKYFRLAMFFLATFVLVKDIIYMPWNTENLMCLIVKISYIGFIISLSCITSILLFTLFVSSSDIANLRLKMFHPYGPGTSSWGGSFGTFGPSGNSGPNGNPGPQNNSGIVGHPGSNRDTESEFESNNRSIFNPIPRSIPTPIPNPNPHPTLVRNPNAHPNLGTIFQKVMWRANYNDYRSVHIFTNVPVVNNYDCNFTGDEIAFLASRVVAHGLENSKPFAVLRYESGDLKGLYRIVRLRDGQTYPDIYSNAVKPTGHLINYLTTLP